jgi:putative Holliday junction resolvase
MKGGVFGRALELRAIMGCLLGIDYGSKRIGLAISDAAQRMALSLETLDATPNTARNVEAIRKVAEEHDVDAFVVGLPLNMNDSEGPQAKLIRTFGQALSKASQKPVHYQDERLSSVTADDLLQPGEFTNKKHKARRDRVAAQVILQQFLDELGRP